MVELLTNLEWVPFIDVNCVTNCKMPPSNRILENPISYMYTRLKDLQLPSDPALAIVQLRLEYGEQAVSGWKLLINRWRTFQNLYQDCGWGTERYDGEEFERRRLELSERMKWVDEQTRISRLVARAHLGHVKAREARAVERELFWAEHAGANAV
jgi:hypothetical protein